MQHGRRFSTVHAPPHRHNARINPTKYSCRACRWTQRRQERHPNILRRRPTRNIMPTSLTKSLILQACIRDIPPCPPTWAAPR
eukprot:92497-Chlamydomonas_euryale.AAC.1